MRKTLILIYISIFSFSVLATEEKEPLVDRVHGKLSTGVVRLSNKIDRFFGSKRAEDQANGTQVRLTYLTSITEDGDIDHEGLIKFRLKLPYLEELLKISFKREANEEKSDEQSSQVKKEEAKGESSSVRRLGEAILNEPKKWSVHFNTGIKVQIPPQVFGNLRLRRSAYFGKWEFRISQEFFWFSRDGFGETTTVDFDRPINSNFLFRVRNLATWTDEEDEFLTEHGPILYWQISKRRAASFSAKAQGASRPSFHINNYQASINYRQLLHKTWFYLETGPVLDFPKDSDWDPFLSYTIKLEAVIGTY